MDVPWSYDEGYIYNQTFSSKYRLGSVSNPLADDFRGNCDCERSMDCLFQMVINDRDLYYRLSDIYYQVPNFYTGCYPIRALLYSSLSCFFDIDCLEIITSAYVSYEALPSSIQLLNTSQLILSTSSTSVLTLTDRLFVEQWDSQVNYSGFYSSCSPLACTYSYIDRPSSLYIFSEALSLIGGLAAVLSILVPTAVRFIMRRVANNTSTSNSEVAEPSSVRQSTILIIVLHCL